MFRWWRAWWWGDRWAFVFGGVVYYLLFIYRWPSLTPDWPSYYCVCIGFQWWQAPSLIVSPFPQSIVFPNPAPHGSGRTLPHYLGRLGANPLCCLMVTRWSGNGRQMVVVMTFQWWWQWMDCGWVIYVVVDPHHGGPVDLRCTSLAFTFVPRWPLRCHVVDPPRCLAFIYLLILCCYLFTFTSHLLLICCCYVYLRQVGVVVALYVTLTVIPIRFYVSVTVVF